MATVLSPPEERVLLRDVSWETYERLLGEQGDRRTPRFTYDLGMLEIMSPSAEHEEADHIITQIVCVVAEEMNLDIRGFGSTTFKRADLGRGFEPDSCFYIQNVERIGAASELDLTVHPPPDLVIEIDITSPSLNKFPLYASVGVPEIWVYDGKRASIYLLEAGNYVKAETSMALPRLTAVVLTNSVAEALNSKRSDWLRSLRAWARQR